MRYVRKVHYAVCTRRNKSRSYSGRVVFRTICGQWYIIDALTEVADNATCLKCKAAIASRREYGLLDCSY